MKILILQTCDGVLYKPFLDLSEPVHQRYASLHGYDYKRYDGVIRGVHACHAAFNRLYLLEKYLDQGYYDFVLYMDADAVIINPKQSLDEFLNHDVALIVCSGWTDAPCDINNGVAFWNLRHQATKIILSEWISAYEAVSPETLQLCNNEIFASAKNLDGGLSDQRMLQDILKKYPPEILQVYSGYQRKVFNYDGVFIYQILNRDSMSHERRIEKMREIALWI